MSVIQRLKSSLCNHGLPATVVKLQAVILDHWFDFRYGLDICPPSELADLTIHSQNKPRGTHYEQTRLLVVRRLLRAIEPILPSDRVLVDIGSGKGRILLAASEFGFREARGVEFAHELCEVARRNCAVYKAKTSVPTEFRIIESDATLYSFGAEENVFTLFNPFDADILSSVIGQMAASVRKNPRDVVIVYYNPKWVSVLDQWTDFSKVREFDFFGIKCVVYANRH